MRRCTHNSSRSLRRVSAVSTSSCENGSSSSRMSGFDDERAGEADALPHAARQFLRIGVLEPVEPDQVDRVDRAPPPLGGRNALRLETQFDIAEHGQPRETARSSGTPSRRRAPARSTGMPRYSTRPSLGCDEPGEDAQEGRFAGSGLAEDRDDLAVAQREIDAFEHQPADMVGRAIGLADPHGAQQRRRRLVVRCVARGQNIRHSACLFQQSILELELFRSLTPSPICSGKRLCQKCRQYFRRGSLHAGRNPRGSRSASYHPRRS